MVSSISRDFVACKCAQYSEKDYEITHTAQHLIVESWLDAYSLSLKILQGHHLDLRLIQNQWILMDPKVEVLMSQANEDKTSGDFREMGQRLAQEVISFVKKKMDKASRCGNLGDIRLSFVGHSIGNLIIRTAIAGRSYS